MTESSRAEGRPLLVNGELLRTRLERINGGGGDKYDPQSIEQARENLAPQVAEVLKASQEIPDDLRASEHLYVEAKLLPNYLAPTYFPGDLLTAMSATVVGSRLDSGELVTKGKRTAVGTRRLILAVPDEGLKILDKLVNGDTGSGSDEHALDQIREFSEIRLPAPEGILTGRPPSAESRNDIQEAPAQVWEAILNPRQGGGGVSTRLDELTLQKWFKYVKELGGSVDETMVRHVGGLTFMPIRLDAEDLAEAARFNPLRTLRPMPSLRPQPVRALRTAPAKLTPPGPQQPLKQTLVGVFDGGLDPSATRELFEVEAQDVTTEAAQADCLWHGTGVTGAVLYGIASPGTPVDQIKLPVTSYRVLPPPSANCDADLYWVVDQIRDRILRDRVRIANLSLGPNIAVEDDQEPHYWTSVLDQLAWEQDVLFVVAAGNDGEADQQTGLHRVQVPADMVNGITVGSCDMPSPKSGWSRAPYSSMGPGRHGAKVQPTGVQFGGAPDNPFLVLGADGSYSPNCGTSFAAPVTTHALAQLAAELPTVNSSVLRAFAVHCAERHRWPKKLLNEIGYGRQALTYEDALQCGPDQTRVLYFDTIERGDLFGYQIPIPKTDTALAVHITLAYSSPVDPAEPTEYTKASIEMTLRPHRDMFTFRPPKGTPGRDTKLLAGSKEAQDLIRLGWTPSQAPSTKSLTALRSRREQDLREAGKWETIRDVQLTLKPGEALEPRLDVAYLARRSGALDSSPSRVPFALLVTVQDKEGGGTLYDEVRQHYKRLSAYDRVRTRAGLHSTGGVGAW